MVADLKLPTTWARHLLPVLLPLFRPFGVTLDLADRHPWEAMARHLEDMTFDEAMLGYVYIAAGRTA